MEKNKCEYCNCEKRIEEKPVDNITDETIKTSETAQKKQSFARQKN